MSSKMKNKIVVAISGSSGSIYAHQLIKSLINHRDEVTTSVVMTDNAVLNWELENGKWDAESIPFDLYDNKDFMAPFASGSADYSAMIICPCSMGMLGRIANGISNDLMTRAADVMLKEKRTLILIPRETPLNLIHLRNLVKLSEAGAIICPAIPSFYSQPKTIEDVVKTVTDRALKIIGIDTGGYKWGSEKD
jgi:4-hydroxy-3-polyprenylbenzoate decarboxylase